MPIKFTQLEEILIAEEPGRCHSPAGSAHNREETPPDNSFVIAEHTSYKEPMLLGDCNSSFVFFG